jgi:hypothetical protein
MMKYAVSPSLAATPAFAHGKDVLHFHAAGLLGLALSVLMITIVGQLS